MRFLSLARFLFALLAFQLAVGLQVDVAYASAAASAMVGGMHTAGQVMDVASAQASSHDSVANTASASSGTAGDDDCPMHSASSRSLSSQDKAPQSASSHGAPHTKGFAGKHDCCKSSGCQGHCGGVPLAFNVSLTRNPPASARVQTARVERAAREPADTHFRPPILS